MSAAVSRDLPIPASPAIRTTLPSPIFALDQRRSSKFGLFLSADEGGQAGRVQRLEAALDRPCSQCRLGARRRGDALQVLGPKVPQLKEIAEKSSGCLRR